LHTLHDICICGVPCSFVASECILQMILFVAVMIVMEKDMRRVELGPPRARDWMFNKSEVNEQTDATRRAAAHGFGYDTFKETIESA